MWKFQRDLVAWGGCSRLVSHNMSFLHHSLFLQHGNWSVWCKCNSCSVFWRFHRKLSGTSWESRNLTSSVTFQSSKFIPHQFTAKVVVATQHKKKSRSLAVEQLNHGETSLSSWVTLPQWNINNQSVNKTDGPLPLATLWRSTFRELQ